MIPTLPSSLLGSEDTEWGRQKPILHLRQIPARDADKKKYMSSRIRQEIISHMDTNKAGSPSSDRFMDILIYIKEATVPFKTKTLADCRNVVQCAFNARTLSVFVAA